MDAKLPPVHLSRFLGITPGDAGDNMCMPFAEASRNHVGSMHAAAQFALAELGSGECLQRCFPEYVGKVRAVVRRATIKYSRPAQTDLMAYSHIEPAALEKCRRQLEHKGRCVVPVQVELRDAARNRYTAAEYEWYVEREERG